MNGILLVYRINRCHVGFEVLATVNCERYGLLGCNAMYCRKSPTFRGI
jgi:hypothetical protein